jgi:molybdate transport system ATP-binding protein
MIWDIDVSKRLGTAKRGFMLDVRFRSQARRLALFGPSGAGKSQTLQMIAGLTQPDKGHVQLGEEYFFNHQTGINLPAQQRSLGYVFQDYALFPHLTVLQNIAFSLHRGLLNPGRKAQHESVIRWLEAFHLESVAHQYPVQLSGGQRQRTALARALVGEPRALLLDEPFAALDQALRKHLRQELAELQSQLNIPMILITHDQEDLDCFADAVIHIQDGQSIRQSTQSDHH